MVYDVFLFFNELDLLKIRLNVLSGVVDYFVLGEANLTFSGNPKPLYYEKNKKMFKGFEDRIIHVTIDKDVDTTNMHERDAFQKDHILPAIKDRLKDDDIIIFSDVDEIPNPVRIAELKERMRGDRVYSFAQRMFYCYLNMEEVSGKLLSYSGDWDDVPRKQWLGTKAVTYGYVRERDILLTDLRAPSSIVEGTGLRVDDGGWHFGYMGGHHTPLLKRVIHKIRSAAHSEYSNWRIFIRLPFRIRNLQDLFGRDARFEIVPIDESYPAYIREHQKELKFYIRRK